MVSPADALSRRGVNDLSLKPDSGVAEGAATLVRSGGGQIMKLRKSGKAAFRKLGGIS